MCCVRWLRRAAIAVGVATIAVACGGKEDKKIVEPPPPPLPVPTSLEANTAVTFPGVAGTESSAVPSVTLRDANRNPISGLYVRFATTGGGRTVSDSVRTDTAGIASSGTWTLGTAAGTQTVVATAAALPPVTFTSLVTADAVQRVTAVFSTTQQATVNGVVALPPSVRAFDRYNNVVPGVPVTFSVVAGGGSIAGGQQLTGADGVATADSWKLGVTPGVQQVRADVTGLASNIVFSAVAVAGPAAKLTLQSGNGGSGVSGAPLESYAPLPTVLVTDNFNNPVSGVAIAFTPSANSGSVVGSPVLSNALGIAAPASWVLGTAAAQSLVATSGAVPGVQVVFNVSAIVTSFDIAVRYADFVPSARQQLAVSRAITRWKSVILGSTGSSRVRLDSQNCGRNWTPAIDEMVSNVLIFARIGPIDGAGGIAGDAGPCVLHQSNGLTVVGTMMFDSADLVGLETSGLIDAVIAHEMGHVLGVGTLFTEKNLVTDLFTNDPIFTGPSTAQQFALLLSGYAGRAVPLENSGGPGSFGGHWRESVFRNELMTGILNGGLNPLSRVTVASLKDIGYEVSFLGADAFSLNATLIFAASAGTALPLWRDVYETQLFTTDKQGRQQKRVPR